MAAYRSIADRPDAGRTVTAGDGGGGCDDDGGDRLLLTLLDDRPSPTGDGLLWDTIAAEGLRWMGERLLLLMSIRQGVPLALTGVDADTLLLLAAPQLLLLMLLLVGVLLQLPVKTIENSLQKLLH